jgi:hypothetical protein
MDDIFILKLRNPTHIISFARSNNLLYKMSFCHHIQYCRSNTALDVARIHNVSASPAGIEYNFRVQVPKEIKTAIKLDKAMEISYGKNLFKQN